MICVEPNCTFAGCHQSGPKRGGLCHSHLRQMRSHGRCWAIGVCRRGGCEQPSLHSQSHCADHRPVKTCEFDGCEEKPVGHGLCTGHYQQWSCASRPMGDQRPALTVCVPLREKPQPLAETCKVQGCERKPKAKALCPNHYRQQRLHGRTWSGRKPVEPQAPLKRRTDREVCQITGCKLTPLAKGVCGPHYMAGRFTS